MLIKKKKNTSELEREGSNKEDWDEENILLKLVIFMLGLIIGPFINSNQNFVVKTLINFHGY